MQFPDHRGQSGSFGHDRESGNRPILCYAVTVEEIRDAIYYQQLARVARAKAAASADTDVALRLREAAIKYERQARRLQRPPA